MKINKAVQKAVKKKKYITLPEFEKSEKIRPTNEKGNCILMGKDGGEKNDAEGKRNVHRDYKHTKTVVWRKPNNNEHCRKNFTGSTAGGREQK